MDNSDGSELSPQNPKDQALLWRRSDFARAMVFEAFQYKHARAIDYDGFIDRAPDQSPRWAQATVWWRAAS